jgi:hypothetical protein
MIGRSRNASTELRQKRKSRQLFAIIRMMRYRVRGRRIAGVALAADRWRSRLMLFGADSRVGQSIEWSELPVPWICALSH